MSLFIIYVFIRLNWKFRMKNFSEAQVKLEDSRHKYFDLYNFVSDGYFTLNKNGYYFRG